MTNLRGNDIDYNPLFFSFAILFFEGENEYLHLFSRKVKFEDEEIRKHLQNYNISLFEYEDLYKVLSLKEKNILFDYLLIVDTESCNQNIFSIISQNTDLKTKFVDEGYVEHTKVNFIF